MPDLTLTSNGAVLPSYDAVVIGGAFAGASFANLLRRLRPESRVLVVERQATFGRKVGEATVEVSACFLHRVMGLYDLLAREHLPKHGLRYWFTDRSDRPLRHMSEVGSGEVPILPSFQLDRAQLDEQLLGLAISEGVDVVRPAHVQSIAHTWPVSRVRIVHEAGEDDVTTRWVVDASGRRAFIARRLGLHQRTKEHPTAAVWARWNRVADLDGPAVLGRDPRSPTLPELPCARRLATNHFCGYGWWIWAIPLAGGETSIGLVYNKTLFEPPGPGTLIERYRHFVTSQAGLQELLANAEMNTSDCHAYRHLPYKATRYMDHGWALVGDAASFMDPYYSPGLDHASMSVYATARLIEDDLRGTLDERARTARIHEHNDQFSRSYDRWLAALYLGKYEIMGDAELTGCAYLVDTALYYMAVVTPIYANIEALRHPVLGPSSLSTLLGFRFMSLFNQRLTHLARCRRQIGTYGRRNTNWHLYANAPGLGWHAVGMLRQGLALWLRCEWAHLWGCCRHGHLACACLRFLWNHFGRLRVQIRRWRSE